MTAPWLDKLSAAYDGPLYVYDLERIRAAHASLRSVLPAGSRLYYSLKANPHPDIVRCLVGLGCHAEVSSVGEVDAAIEGGTPPDRMLYTGPGKTVRAIAHALRAGVRRFSIESAADLDRVATQSVAERAETECLVRVNRDAPPVGSSITMTGVASQFGVDSSALIARPDLFVSRPGARVVGYHLYAGSNIAPERALVEHLHENAILAARLAQITGSELREVDLGGGFPAPYAGRGPTLDLSQLSTLDGLVASVWPDGAEAPLVSFESGRYLVAASGSLLCRVIERKVSKGRSYVILESGINHLGGMSGLRRLPRPQPHVEVLGESPGRVTGSLVGPLCTPVDCLSHEADIPVVQEDSVLLVPDVGAYGLTASLIAFLGHPAPTELVVDGPEVVSATRLTVSRHPMEGAVP